MRKSVALAGIVAIVACSSEKNGPTDYIVSAPLYVRGANADNIMGTHLTGNEEPLPVDPSPSLSDGEGQAIFRISGTKVEFRLIASNIHNVIMAHIHCDIPGSNGPIAQWLFPNTGTGPSLTPPGITSQNGVLASGTVDLAGVNCPIEAAPGGLTNPANGVPLLTAMRNGWTYVNVHTNDGVAPTNTGPGDFPGGEIRGQLDGDN